MAKDSKETFDEKEAQERFEACATWRAEDAPQAAEGKEGCEEIETEEEARQVSRAFALM